MTPREYYQHEITLGHIQLDQRQLPVIDVLDTIYQELQHRAQHHGWFSWLHAKPPVKGLYLWGNIGIGKTFLMDCFYNCLTIPKLRLHFHQFMFRIHNELKNIQGHKNPLQLIAKKISLETKVICFDEFFVSNVADAMILGELFFHLFKNGVTLVTSSNISPDLLYKEGLQRERFLRAIDLIKKNTHVLHLHSHMDYRQQHIRQTGVFYTPLDQTADKHLENAFIHFSNGAPATCDPIMICDRPISIIKQAGNVLWVDFVIICGRPRSQNDYLAIASRYHTIIVQNFRPLLENEQDLLLSFIYFVDILYDAHCRLIISSSVPLAEIMLSQKSALPFQRTLSRLTEMQSEKYVYRDGLPKEMTSI